MQSNKHCEKLFQWSHIVSAKAVLKALRTACGIFSVFLAMPSAAKAALPQFEGRIERRPTRERLERSSRELDYLSHSGQREVARRLRRDLASEIDPESKQSLKRLFAETPFYGSETRLKPFKGYEIETHEDQAVDRERPEYIRWVQESINRVMGMALTVDGILTPEVKEAIREFQRSNGLDPDGIVGPKTERKLSEVTNTTVPESWFLSHLRHPSLLHWLEESEFGEQVQLEVEKKTVFLEVNKRKGGISVTASTDVDFWLKGAGLPRLANETALEVSSLDDIEKMVGDANTVVLQGDDLPEGWSDRLGEKRDYLRNSLRSPKKSLGDYIRAGELLERRAELGKTRVFDALPQAREETELKRELRRMNHGTDEIPEWQEHHRRMDVLRAESPFDIEPATKEAVLQELRSGSNDTVILIAHSTDGNIHFPDGRTITTSEISSINRLMVPERNVIIISCEAGIVNRRVQSPSEILLGGNAALNLIAKPNRISAEDVPDTLREFLVEKKRIKDVFIPRGYVPITENLEYNLDPKVTPLVSGDVLNKPLTTSVPS